MNDTNSKPLVSVVIPTYNRFKYVLRAIESINSQTYIKNGGSIEIILVNDRSTDQDYYEHSFDSNVSVVHLDKNTRQIFGFACAGYVRTIGINHSKGKYIAFLDDDDWWTSD
jgi:glycosyltransferase involved in cell wall biosynthesis